MKLRNDSSEHVESAQLLTDRGRKRAGNSGMSGILCDTGSPGYKTMEDSGGGIKKLSGSRGSLTSGKGSRRPSVMSGLDDNGSDIVDKSSFWKFLDFVNVFTIFVGVNFLGLPYTVSTVGIVPAVIILCGITLVTYHGCSLLLTCKEKIDERKIRDSNESIQEIEKSLKLGYALLAKDAFGPIGESVVTISIFFIHFCFCIGYIIYLGNSMEALSEDFHKSRVCSKQAFEKRAKRELMNVTEWPKDGLANLSDFAFYRIGNLTHDVELDCDFRPSDAPTFDQLVWLMSPLFVILCLPNLQLLRDFLNLLAFITIIFVYSFLLIWLLQEARDRTFTPSHELFIAKGILFTFGQASSTLEGMGTVTELSDELHESPSYVQSYVAKTMAIALPAYMALGIVGYVVLGSQVEQVITRNLGPDENLSLMVNFLVVCLILFGYPTMAYPGQKVLDQWCYQIITRQWCRNLISKQAPTKHPQTDGTKAATISDSQQASYPSTPTISGINTTSYNSIDSNNTTTTTSDNSSTTEAREKHKWAAKLAKFISGVTFVLSTIALSTIFQTSFIYISAFTGAMDNCLLSLIFPAAIHFKVTQFEDSQSQGQSDDDDESSRGRLSYAWRSLAASRVKDALMMVFGVCLAGVSLIVFTLVNSGVSFTNQ